ncbi:ATP-dependent DNA helicase [Mycena indigotica]|uniref:ATP-dependent DNA helicase n=1 Tax=Mycena indigotica TaxID=2126181 RepID=A0A8H6RZ21_9AGAR|nr:ATP-dependent DNA helicase [Mycena indigotica]KAF7289954.1 ATP-dependent DNA helicase [Mycena indigotica]
MQTAVAQALRTHTVQEIILMLEDIQPAPRNCRHKRDNLLNYVSTLPPALFQRVLQATTNRGSKRVRNDDASNRPRKRRKLEVKKPIDAPQMVHGGDLLELINGPFLQRVDDETVRNCISRVIDATGNEAIKKGVCFVCARRLFQKELITCEPEKIPNPKCLQPTHPHASQKLYNGMLLHAPPLRRPPPHFICRQCWSKLAICITPPLSLANNMWIGEVPFELSILTLPERLLVGLYFPVAYIVKLFPKRNRDTNPDHMKSGLRGNVSSYHLDSSAIADMVTGNLMPRPIGLLASVLSVTFVGAKNVPLSSLPDLFKVQRHRVKANNPLYANINISKERLLELPENDVPEELTTTVRCSEDPSIPLREHAGYAPMDASDDVDDNVAEAEERDFQQRTDLLPVDALRDDGAVETEEYPPAVFPLQPHGAIDISGDAVTDQDLFREATRNFAPSSNTKDYAVRPGSTFVNEYPREDAGQRTDGGPSNANHLLADPIAQVLAGADIDLDHFVASLGPNSETRSTRIAADPFASAEYFHLFVKVILEELFGIKVNTLGTIQRSCGVIGYVNGYIGTVEAQARGSLHLHLLLWLRGAPTAIVMRNALLSESFRVKMANFIAKNIRAHIPNTTGEMLLSLPVKPNISFSRPVDPRTVGYETRSAEAESRIARAVQTHDCDVNRCLKVKNGRLVCKRRAPWRTADNDWVTETGDWGPKRLYAKINAWNPPLLQVTRANNDFKLITNGAETKDITFYITLYIAKRQIQTANASALMAKALEFQEKLSARQKRNLDKNKRLLQSCSNILTRQQEFSGPEVVSYLMGWGDRFISHSYVTIYWDRITAQLRRFFPYLGTITNDHEFRSTMTTENVDDYTGGRISLTRDSDGVIVLKDQLKEYEDRGDALANMNFYDYFTLTYDGKMTLNDVAQENDPTADGMEVDAESEDTCTQVLPEHTTLVSSDIPVAPRKRGRPRSIRVPYRKGTKREGHCRVLRGKGQEINLHFIGQWFPKQELTGAAGEYYSAQMLLLFQPWRSLHDLANGQTSFCTAFQLFQQQATPEQLRIITNIQYFHECTQASRRREETEQQSVVKEKKTTVDHDAMIGVLPTTSASKEPSEEEIAYARENRQGLRERMFGQQAVDIAFGQGIFAHEYKSSRSLLPPAKQATIDDMAKFHAWGKKIAAYTKKPTIR